jgi:hypothetical protein
LLGLAWRRWEFKNGTTPGGIPETVAIDPTLKESNPAAMDFFYDTTAEATDLWDETFGSPTSSRTSGSATRSPCVRGSTSIACR